MGIQMLKYLLYYYIKEYEHSCRRPKGTGLFCSLIL